MRKRVVLVTGMAPYLGGPATWEALRREAPEYDFLAVDLLEIVDEPELAEAGRNAIEDALDGAAAIVAHATAAKLAIEAVNGVAPSLPVLLVSPMLVTETTPMLRAVAGLSGTFGGTLLTAIARSKHRRLLADPAFLRKQLAVLVRDEAISEELLEEAGRRIADRRTAESVARSAEVLRFVLTPIDARIMQAVLNRSVLVGTGAQDRKTRSRMSCAVIAGAGSAAMLERPRELAEYLRAIVEKPGRRQGGGGG